ncbi:MAG: polysaccharide pyruvyl transferase family protein [Clostridia bacterium]|nr:polysaccharide pyruvyl transferase family protein [Clostridia bacterium]
MKIRLMTFHTPKNYGAVLQAYSLYSYLKTKSDDTKIIDYNTEHLRSLYPLIPKITSVKVLANVLLSLHNILPKKRKYEKFDNFVKNNLELTKRYSRTSELYAEPPEADIIFTGSDQVFGPNRIKDERQAFYLDFADKPTVTASYAASFGIKQIPKEKQAEIKSYLEKLDYISVRENSGKDIVKSCIGRQVQEVLDPVFLNDAEFWDKASKPYDIDLKNYIFYYRLMGKKDSDESAIKIAKEQGKKLVVMTGGRLKFKADKVLRDVGPQEFLSLMSNADYIITDSFHGVAFSLIFKKQFAFVDFNEVLQERAMLLMEKVGISDIGYARGTSFGKELDYEHIKESLDDLILLSKEYINEVIDSVENI